jgi:hypothetical protein
MHKNILPLVELKIGGELIDISDCNCPPNKERSNCFLSGSEVDQRATCGYCWLYYKLESTHPDAKQGRLRRAFDI